MTDSLYFEIARYSQPPLILLGTIGALLNQILFFTQRSLRNTSCSLYFRALSFNDLLVLYIVVLPGWLSSQFDIELSRQSNFFCRTKTYLNDSLYTLSPYFIVLACFDRLCTSSANVHLRRIASIKIASCLIPTMVFIVFLAYSHVPVWYALQISSTTRYCISSNSTYTKVLSLFLFLFLCITPPILMTILCTTTLILLRQQRLRIMPINQTRLRQRDNHLLKMLFIYVLSHIICTFPFTVTYVILVFMPTAYTRVLYNLFRIFSLLFNMTFALSFYVYTLCTPFYRHELINLFQASQRRFARPSMQTASVRV